jgi:O-6-methylguanine DNA methyltransferase
MTTNKNTIKHPQPNQTNAHERKTKNYHPYANTMNESLYYAETETPYGVVGLSWNHLTHKIHQIDLNTESQKRHNPPPQIQNLLDNIKRFLLGENITFDLSLLELERCSEFQKRVLIAEYNIPRGTVSTYTRIANHIGSPKAARAVGNALATNPFPIVIPCHRAVRSNGTLGGYQGGSEMKKRLLQMEGIKIKKDRFDLSKITY